jgi:hypothetical protein
MTTYPLSEPATIYRSTKFGSADNRTGEVVGRGTLSDCAEILEGWSPADRASVLVEMTDQDLRYNSEEIEELLKFLREEHAD